MSTTTTTSGARAWIRRPHATADPRRRTSHRAFGIGLAAVGLVLVLTAAVGNWFATGDLGAGESIASTLAWTFAVTTTGFGLAKLGIAVILVGIIVRLWHRANSVGASLVHLRARPTGAEVRSGDFRSDYGPATVHDRAPELLPVHRMAKQMWLPALVLGGLAVAGGLILGLAASATEAGTSSFREMFAWTQGTMFLGEALLLTGIGFLLGAIMANLRTAGSQVQEALGVDIQTLRMPAAAKAFLGLMMLGLAMAITQFVGYIVAAGRAGDPQAFVELTTWLGPFRETALGVILVGIVLALVAIGNALGFQFDRVRRLITTGV